MSMIIQANMPFINAQNKYKISTGKKADSAEKLSSGYRINRAADDAAGLAGFIVNDVTVGLVSAKGKGMDLYHKLPPGFGHQLVGVEDQGDGAVVDGRHLHIRAELAVLHPEAPGAALLLEALVEGDGDVGLAGLGEAGAAAGGVGVEGELGDDQQRAAHLLQIEIHLAVLVLKDAELDHLGQHLIKVSLGVPLCHAEQNEQSVSTFTDTYAVHVHRRRTDSLNHSLHGNTSLYYMNVINII